MRLGARSTSYDRLDCAPMGAFSVRADDSLIAGSAIAPDRPSCYARCGMRGVRIAVAAALVSLSGCRAPTRAELRPSGAAAALDRIRASLEQPDAGADDGGAAPEPDDSLPPTLELQRARLYERMRVELELDDAALEAVRKIVDHSSVLGQGNPAITRHPMTRAECRRIRADAGLVAKREPMCGAPAMVPLFDPGAGEKPEDARVCIDQFEFPNIPCEYPVVYARANEAAELCRAIGKRICDAHEWEGACAGALKKPEVEYVWDRPRPDATWVHNTKREIVWSYGPKKDHSRCGTGSRKSKDCEAGGWTLCGSNTYPAGSFPDCVSPFGVFDLHGNVAEHMNLPLAPEELASAGGTGATEMKGSWFVFGALEVHEDDCRWRAKDWHPSRLMDVESHRNYHLGFRCCKDAPPAMERDAGP